MFGLPENTDLSFFKDKILLQVCIGCNEAILHFDDDVSVTIEGEIGHRSEGMVTALYKTIIPSAPILLDFIHASIVKALVQPPGTLLLEFSNGEALEIYDSSTGYESYQIKSGEKIIVV
jgi:hypothetical protein